MDSNELLHMAREAKAQAYAPYSGFPVGAALYCEDGSVFFGANVENASYSLGVCAERVAILKAVSAGRIRFQELAINSDSEQLTFPCGACLQVMAEFSPDMSLSVTVSNRDLDYMTFTLRDLLPFAFQLNQGNSK
ncbi:MAG: cytidine deaminase [Syntrophomonadaceae bacterium]|nr:cytidine deaminase [Syntrophomonadaceae bacterium]